MLGLKTEAAGMLCYAASKEFWVFGHLCFQEMACLRWNCLNSAPKLARTSTVNKNKGMAYQHTTITLSQITEHCILPLV